jgi:altronate dehydratase
MKPNILIIHPRDNVAVVLSALAAGEKAVAQGVEGLTALSDIPASHKIALADIVAGGEIIKYGETVAVSTRNIKKGEWVHTHNLESKRWKR